MDPQRQTNCLLLLGLPPKALAGIDLLSFTTSPRFQGVKNLPPGLHFVFAAGDQSLSIRHGAWFYVSPGSGPPQVFVKKWDPAKEDLTAETSQAEVMRLRANLGTIWKEALTPYRQTVNSGAAREDETAVEESTDWSDLTSEISPTLLSRITGLNPDHWSLSSVSTAEQDLERIPGLEGKFSDQNPEKELRFLPIDLKKTWREGATGRERTEAAQDRSWALGDLLEKSCQGSNSRARESEVLGELQFAFLMVITLNNNSCLEQWKRLLKLLFTCRKAVKDRTRLFLQLLKTLRLQLKHCADMEASVFDMSDYGGGFLRPLLQRFRQSLEGFDGEWKVEIADELDDLLEFLAKEFSWEATGSYVKRGMLDLEDGERVEMDMNGVDEEEEEGEYAPAIVQLTPEQLKQLEGSDVDREFEMEEEADLEDMDTRF